MSDINRFFILILLCGLLYALYVYQERESKKITPNKRKPVKKVNEYAQQQQQPTETENNDNQTLGSLMDVDSLNSLNSDTGDSLFD